jgi:hypothetical protein
MCVFFFLSRSCYASSFYLEEGYMCLDLYGLGTHVELVSSSIDIMLDYQTKEIAAPESSSMWTSRRQLCSQRANTLAYRHYSQRRDQRETQFKSVLDLWQAYRCEVVASRDL